MEPMDISSSSDEEEKDVVDAPDVKDIQIFSAAMDLSFNEMLGRPEFFDVGIAVASETVEGFSKLMVEIVREKKYLRKQNCKFLFLMFHRASIKEDTDCKLPYVCYLRSTVSKPASRSWQVV